MTSAREALGPQDLSAPGCYVYGVVPWAEGLLPSDLTGLSGAPVRLVREGELAVVVSDLPLDQPPGRAPDVVAHHEVLDAIAGATSVVPVQFGSLLASEEDVREDLLLARGDDFAALLEELAGRAQMNLRASYLDDVVLAEVVREDPDVAELRRRTRDVPEDQSYGDRVRLGELVARALDAKRGPDADALMTVVEPLVAAWSERTSGSGSGDTVLDVALLVDLDRLTEVEDTLEGLAEAVHERMRLQLVGPLAPYDFVGGAAWA